MDDFVRNDKIDEGRIIIVEGANDRNTIQKVLQDAVPVICTYGTFGVEKFDEMLEKYHLDDKEVYIFVDQDEAGRELRKELTRELPDAYQLYATEEWPEVENAPANEIAKELAKHNFNVHPLFLL